MSDFCLVQVTLAHAHEANQRIVEQLNDQVDFLNKQLALRESQLHKVGSLGPRGWKSDQNQSFPMPRCLTAYPW